MSDRQTSFHQHDRVPDAAGAERVYAALDGAAIPGLPGRLGRFACRAECLYLGQNEPDIQAVAPWLLELDAPSGQDEPKSWFLNGAAREPWGVLVRSSVPFIVLRRHLRSLNLVRVPQAGTVLFRWYDPRVLPAFLNILDKDQLSRTYGPVESFGIVDPDGIIVELPRPAC